MKRCVGLIAVLLVVVGCKKGKHDDSSAGSGSGSGSAVTPPPVATAPADAPDAPTFSQAITSDGVGPVNASTDLTTVGSLFPGLTAKTEHSEASGRSLDTTSLAWPSGVTILQIVVDNVRNEVRAEALGAGFATAAGIRVGSTVADVVKAYPDAECRRETIAGTTTQLLYCSAASLPNIQFQLDPAALSGEDGKVPAARLPTAKVTRISWVHARAGAAAAAAVTPLCLAKGGDLVIDRLVATADSVTFCAPGQGSLACATVNLTTGEVSTPATPPPAATAADDGHTNADGNRRLQRDQSGPWTVVDIKSGKVQAKLDIRETDHACLGDAQFVGTAIYVEAQACDKPHSVGYLFKPTGELIGKKALASLNIHHARPFAIENDRALLHAWDSEEVLFVNLGKATEAVQPIAPADKAEGCCVARVNGSPSLSPFAKLPDGKVVVVGAAVGVLDPSNGALERSWLLPACN